MATAAKHICRQARRVSQHRTQWLQYRQSQLASPSTAQWHHPLRSFSSTTSRCASDKDDAPSEDAGSSAPYFNQKFFETLDRADRADYRTLSPADRKRMESVAQSLNEELFSRDSRTTREIQEMVDRIADEVAEEFPDAPQERPPRNDGFFAMGEGKEDMGPDDEFQEDDISSTAHGELEQHREIREYARLAGWEMPLLANLTKPFEPPTSATPLRFRYTTYLGEQHPAARKIVVEFCPTDLSLTPTQTAKLIKLCGPRYNPSTQIVRMSCESFETQAQNKRYLGDTVGSLIAEAKDPKDTFEDVPFDFRHHKPKPKLQFPEEWLLTEERKRELEEKRRLRLEAETKRTELGELVSGVQAIEEGRKIDVARAEAPVMEMAQQKLPSGKMGKQAMGQRNVRK